MESSIENRKNTARRKKPKPAIQRRASHRFTAKAKCKCSFLNEEFQYIPAVDLPDCEMPFGQVFKDNTVFWEIGKDIRIDAKNNIKTLAASIEQYSRINNQNFEFNPTDNPKRDLHELLDIANSVKIEDVEIAVDYDYETNQLVFAEYAYCEFYYDTLFFLPVKFVEKVPEEYRPLIEELCGYISTCYGLQEPTDHFDLSFALGLWENDFGEEMDPEDLEEYKKDIQSYLHGDINKIIKNCTAYPSDPNAMIAHLKDEINRHKGTKLGSLLERFLEGIELMNEDSLSRFFISSDYCGIDDFNKYGEDMLDTTRLFAVVYDLYDAIVERAEECIKGDAGCLDIAGLYTRRIITSDINTIMEPSDFPKKWCEWFINLMIAIKEYE